MRIYNDSTCIAIVSVDENCRGNYRESLNYLIFDHKTIVPVIPTGQSMTYIGRFSHYKHALNCHTLLPDVGSPMGNHSRGTSAGPGNLSRGISAGPGKNIIRHKHAGHYAYNTNV